jgi:hypothetical protein
VSDDDVRPIVQLVGAGGWIFVRAGGSPVSGGLVSPEFLP